MSINYTPDLAASYHYTTQIDTSGRKYRFSKYDGGGLGGGLIFIFILKNNNCYLIYTFDEIFKVI